MRGELVEVVIGLVVFGKKENELRGVKSAGLDIGFDKVLGGRTFDELLPDESVSGTPGFCVVRADE